MTRPKADSHKRERPGGAIERETADLAGLVADAIAVGLDPVASQLRAMPATVLRRLIEDEIRARVIVLLREARGDRGRASELLAAEWRRWTY